MKVQLVTPYRVSNWQSYGGTVRSDVASVYPPLLFFKKITCLCFLSRFCW